MNPHRSSGEDGGAQAEDLRLDALLRGHFSARSPLPDTGFTGRVLRALPPRVPARRAGWRRLERSEWFVYSTAAVLGLIVLLLPGLGAALANLGSLVQDPVLISVALAIGGGLLALDLGEDGAADFG